MSDTIESLDIELTGSSGQAASSIERLIGKLGKLGNVAGNSNAKMRTSVAAMREGAGAAEGFATKLGNLTRESRKASTGFAQGFREGFTDSIGKGESSLIRFAKQLKRIATYRAFRSAITFITGGFSQGIKDLYAWSSLADGRFKASMDSLATSAHYAGDSIAAMASPLIDALAPAVDFIIDKFVTMFNIINQILARLSGRSTYTAAVKTASAWSDAAKKSGGAAAEMRKTILAFDEINKLQDKSGGGGGAGSSADAGALFEERAIDGRINEFVASIKLAFRVGDWRGLGTLLGEKVNEIIDSVPFAEYGAKVGGYINAWFSTRYWTLETINFQNIGAKIAEFLNGEIANIDWNTVGRMITQKLTIIGDAVIGFFTTLDWGNLAQSLSDFIIGRFEQLSEWLDKQDWGELGSTLLDSLLAFFTNLDYSGLATGIANFLWSAIKAAVGLVSGFVGLAGGDSSASLEGSVGNILAGIVSMFDGVLVPVGLVMLTMGHPLLGVAMLASALAGKYTLDAANSDDSLTNEVQEKLALLGGVIAPALFTIGAILAFSGHPAIGIAMMAANAGTIGGAIAANWDEMPNTITRVIAAISAAIGLGKMAIGAMLAFGGHPALGIALIISGLTSTAASAINWGGIPDQVQRTILDILAIVGPAKLALGAVLLFSGHFGLGLALVLSGLVTTASVVANWDSLSDKMESIISNVTGIIGKASLMLGMLMIVCQQWGLGLGLILLGVADLSVSAATNQDFDGLKNKITKIVSDCVGAISTGFLMLGILAIVTGNWAIGLGLIAAGVIGLVATSGADWDSLQDVGLKAYAEVKAGWDAGGPLSITASIKTVQTISTVVEGVKETAENYRFGDVTKGVASADLSAYGRAWKGLFGSSGSNSTSSSTLPSGAGGNAVVTSSGIVYDQDQAAARRKALGGIFSGGIWHSLPSFANGVAGLRGTLFWAGEAGPEIVGNANGRTEVLNKSQIASAMFAAVRSAMAPTEIGMREAMNGGVNSYRSNGNADATLIELLREQNALLQEIAEKEITTSGINYAQRRANRRAGTTIVPVGT